MISVYKALTRRAEPIFNRLLDHRLKQHKEDEQRLDERKGRPSLPRGDGELIWLHAASVGEAQSALILIKELLKYNKALRVLVTTGTQTSATLMAKTLPERAFHQFYPLDHPAWCENFTSHWRPDCALWVESELWPNMLQTLKKHEISTALINAKLSKRSFSRWRFLRGSIKQILSTFALLLTQTQTDTQRFEKLGAKNVKTTGNLKYSAEALPFEKDELTHLKAAMLKRPVWLFASTHQGEERLACRIHARLKEQYPDLLTIIVPRHPERGPDIKNQCKALGMHTTLRGEEKLNPKTDTDIYIANTLGELGLFYRACGIACIGRSFSDDGGGGHNPIEAAKLNCAVLYGPNVQYLQEIFDDMKGEMAAVQCQNENALGDTLLELLSDEEKRRHYQQKALGFAQRKDLVLADVMKELTPFLVKAGIETTNQEEVA